MRGHWLSGTRKLNKHYQSGGGEGLKTFTYRDMQWPIYGFEYDAPDGYESREIGYYNATSENIEFAPTYKLFNSAYPSTVLSTETRYVLYSKVWRYDNGYYKKSTSSSDVIRGQYPVWHYGEFRGDPYWAYNTNGYNDPLMGWMVWAEVIRHNGGTGANQINQDGIFYNQALYGNYWPSGVYSSNYRFEDIYNGKTLKVLIPVFDLVAIPNLMTNPLQVRVDITDEEDPAEPAILKLKYSGSKPNRVYSGDDPSYNFNYMTNDINETVSEYFNLGSGNQIGSMGSFCENLYTMLTAYDQQLGVHRIVAGYASGQEMVYAIRLKWLEVADVDPTTKIVFTTH